MADRPDGRTIVRRHLEEAEDAAGISGVPAGGKAAKDAGPSPNIGGSNFNWSKARKPTAEESSAKMKGLAKALRGRDQAPADLGPAGD